MFNELRVPEFGYTSADPKLELPKNALITGSVNVMFGGEKELESARGWTRTSYGGVTNRGGDISMILGKGWATIGNELGEGSGNIIEFVGRSLWYTGTGDITVWMPGITATPQALGNSPSQNNIPQISVLNPTHTGYDPPVQVGLLAQTEAPILLVPSVPSPGFQGKMTGTFAVELTWLRSSTGGESLPSDPSNVVSVANQTVVVKFPTPSNAVLPRDKWRVYGTPAGFGATGPFLFFMEVYERRISSETGTGYIVTDTVTPTTFNVFKRNPLVVGWFSTEQIGKRLVIYDGGGIPLHVANITGVIDTTTTIKGVTYGSAVTFSPAYSGGLTNTTHAWGIDTGDVGDGGGRELEMEWSDNELLPIQPPTDFFPPGTTASFVAALSNIVCLIGTDDGVGIAVSVPNFPEAFPPDFRLNLPEVPNGVLARPKDGYFIVTCENSIHEVRWTGAVDGPPVALRQVTDLVGAAGQRASCQAGNDLYLFTKGKKPARILADGRIDTTFGDRVQADFESWDSSKVFVVFDEKKSYIAYGYFDKMLLYYPNYDTWAAPIDKSSFEATATFGGFMYSAFTLSGIIHTSVFDSRLLTNISIGLGSNNPTGTLSLFAPEDVGKVISIPTAGSGGSALVAVITTFINSNSILISTTAVNPATSVTATISGFDMYTFDRDQNGTLLTGKSTWIARYAFSDYGVGLNPKTVTRARVGIKSHIGFTYQLSFRADYDLSTSLGPTRTFVASAGNFLSAVVDCNNGEAELLSVQLRGVGAGDKLFFIEVTGDDSAIYV